MTSTKTLMPLDYYHLPFCQPDNGPQKDNENLGEFLAGDRIESSPYVLLMKREMYCEQICVTNLGRDEQRGVQPNRLVKAIRREYVKCRCCVVLCVTYDILRVGEGDVQKRKTIPDGVIK